MHKNYYFMLEEPVIKRQPGKTCRGKKYNLLYMEFLPPYGIKSHLTLKVLVTAMMSFKSNGGFGA